MSEAFLTFYRNGEAITSKAQIVAAMNKACMEQGHDPEEVQAIAARMFEDEDAREMFESMVGLEVRLTEGD